MVWCMLPYYWHRKFIRWYILHPAQRSIQFFHLYHHGATSIFDVLFKNLEGKAKLIHILPPSSQEQLSIPLETRRPLPTLLCPKTDPNHIVWGNRFLFLVLIWETDWRKQISVFDPHLRTFCWCKISVFDPHLRTFLLLPPGLMADYASVTAESVLRSKNLW